MTWVLTGFLLAVQLAVPCGSLVKGEESGKSKSRRAPYGQVGLVPMEFDVDPTLLGFTYEDSTLDLRFAPPRGWPPVEPSLLDQTRVALAQIVPEADRFHARPIRIFYEMDRRLFMILGELHHWDTPLNPYTALVEYRRRVESAMTDVEILGATYLLRDMAVYQLLITNPIMVNFRLILIREGKLPVQVDYLVPRGAYPDLVKAIEASIGSIESF